eukprot:3807791-Rhodomonas_salina.1
MARKDWYRHTLSQHRTSHTEKAFGVAVPDTAHHYQIPPCAISVRDIACTVTERFRSNAHRRLSCGISAHDIASHRIAYPSSA